MATTNSAAGPAAKDGGWWKRGWETIHPALPVFATYWLAIFAGTLGALISILRRLQTMSLDGDADTNLVALDRSSASVTYSPLLGAVFALLLLFMFMGGMIDGSLFPKCKHSPDHIFLGCVPQDCMEIAKLIIWCFIAGFAEKFVPDALDKIQAQSSSAKSEGK